MLDIRHPCMLYFALNTISITQAISYSVILMLEQDSKYIRFGFLLGVSFGVSGTCVVGNIAYISGGQEEACVRAFGNSN